MSEKNRKKRVNWTDNEIRALLNHWEENIIDLRKSKRNLKICIKIARKLSKYGMHKSAQEIATKISNLTKKFRKERKLGGSSSEGESWRYYDDVNRIIGKFSSNDSTALSKNPINFSSVPTLLNPSSDSIDTQNVSWEMEHPKATTSSSKINVETPFSMEEKILTVMNVNNDFNITVKSEIEDDFPPKEDSLPRPETDAIQEEIIPSPSNASVQSSPNTSINDSRSNRQIGHKRKRSDLHLQEQILEEIKRSNRVFEEEMKKANEIDKEYVNIQKQMLELFKTICN